MLPRSGQLGTILHSGSEGETTRQRAREGEGAVHVVIVGCGRVGSELAVSLEKLGHTVAVIDKDANAFRRWGDMFSGQKIIGFGFDRDALTDAGIERADAVAAVTSGDNSNILAARIAHENFGIERVVARIKDPRRAEIYQRLGISTVAMISWTTDQVMRRLLPGEEQPHEWLDASGKVCLVDFPIPAGWAGKKLAELSEPGVFWLVAVTRLGNAQISTPSVIGQDGDILHFMVDVNAMDALRERLQHGSDHH
jgi:trk system potassium uptake protein TrkA